MGLLNRSTILEADDRKPIQVDVPEWGGHVFVRPLSGTERDRLEHDFLRKKESRRMENMRARLAVDSICDDNGELMFTRADVKDLKEKSAAALERVFTVAMKVSMFSEEDMEQLVDDLVGN